MHHCCKATGVEPEELQKALCMKTIKTVEGNVPPHFPTVLDEFFIVSAGMLQARDEQVSLSAGKIRCHFLKMSSYKMPYS